MLKDKKSWLFSVDSEAADYDAVDIVELSGTVSRIYESSLFMQRRKIRLAEK